MHLFCQVSACIILIILRKRKLTRTCDAAAEIDGTAKALSAWSVDRAGRNDQVVHPDPDLPGCLSSYCRVKAPISNYGNLSPILWSSM